MPSLPVSISTLTPPREVQAWSSQDWTWDFYSVSTLLLVRVPTHLLFKSPKPVYHPICACVPSPPVDHLDLQEVLGLLERLLLAVQGPLQVEDLVRLVVDLVRQHRDLYSSYDCDD